MILDGSLSDEAKKFLQESSKSLEFDSMFDFLLNHNGLRDGAIHTILGVSHGGKSTLVRSLIADILTSNEDKRILLWLSEETRLEFLTELSYVPMPNFKNRLFIFSEMDNSPGDNLLAKIWHIVKEKEVDVVLYDNITTGHFYMDKGVQDQSIAVKKLRRMVAELNIPMIVVAHAGANVVDNNGSLIEMNNIRGSKALVNMSQFFYIMQTFQEDQTKHSTIRTTKHRGQQVLDTMFLLNYAPSARMYKNDMAVGFKKFKELFKKRNKL